MAGLSSILMAVLGAGSTIYQAKKQEKAANRQMDMARDSAIKQEQKTLLTERQTEAAMNKANQRQPDANAILSAARQRGKAGASGTMLTGSRGVNTDSLNLGRPSLLGA